MKIKIIVGLGFGDEGKGNVVNAISDKDSLIVRFNGSNQSGHTVYHNGVKHIFSSFGSGTMKGAMTYLSEYLTVDPLSVQNEFDILIKMMGTDMSPSYIHQDTQLITPFDVMYNRKDKKNIKNGTCGIGFGSAVDRQEKGYNLRVRDIDSPRILDRKVEMIMDYYLDNRLLDKLEVGQIIAEVIDKWKEACINLTATFGVVDNIQGVPNLYKDVIFEGGQGIMLDRDFGFFPHVTRSNTTSKNAWELILDLKMASRIETTVNIETLYVTRAYQTRHGNGPITNDRLPFSIIVPNKDETNVEHEFQGKFRVSKLDFDSIRYAIECDSKFSEGSVRTLVVTCLDQMEIPDGNNIPVTVGFTAQNQDMPIQVMIKLLRLDRYIACADKELILK